MTAKLVWITPDAEKHIAYLARVSNPKASLDDDSKKLINYLFKNKHWSPFEMVCACVEIKTTRDIAHQIIRHRSFHFQEFSQRYSKVTERPVFGAPRLQDPNNRQNSIELDDNEFWDGLKEHWDFAQREVWKIGYHQYSMALEAGIAKEVARKLLPEGLTPTKMYMQGTIRDWIHYISIRTQPSTQLEHRAVANEILNELKTVIPEVLKATLDD